MLIRIRNNVGTWKLQLDTDNGDIDYQGWTVKDVLSDGAFEQYKLVQPLSLDPSGTKPLLKTKTLLEQGLSHGSMIYCRVKERDLLADDDSDSSVEACRPQLEKNRTKPVESLATNSLSEPFKEPKVARKATSALPSRPSSEVIEILSSDDEGDTNKSKRKPSPVKKKRAATKRPSSPFDGASGSTSAKKARTNPTSQSSAPQKESSSSSIDFKIASYNIWFGPPDPTVNQLYPKERMEAIAKVLEQIKRMDGDSPLLFVGFQEMTTSLRMYLQPHLETMGYRLATQPLGDAYGVGLAVSKQLEVLESKFVPYSLSVQGRGVLFARTATHLFCTTHLESFINQSMDGSKEREVQIRQAAYFCQDQLTKHPNLEVAMIAGDFNWDDERKRGQGPNRDLLAVLDDGWKDAGEKFDYTYDAKENCMLAGNLRRRFDRCIYLTPESKRNKAKAGLKKFGMAPIHPPLIWNKRNPYNNSFRKVKVGPSDHFAIGVRFLLG
ncbi:unnamed protein product [Cylindrotheca closterium]|uniref:Endonuclease/exonuclease/phosphatase domain-containing protein n=1 Tax=Cylindrotheca closterium TaxID=2856 RepID=A0AAD2G677_9STRA|nr:unnamed protein product [Cylindrotheca closterium]